MGRPAARGGPGWAALARSARALDGPDGRRQAAPAARTPTEAEHADEHHYHHDSVRVHGPMVSPLPQPRQRVRPPAGVPAPMLQEPALQTHAPARPVRAPAGGTLLWVVGPHRDRRAPSGSSGPHPPSAPPPFRHADPREPPVRLLGRPLGRRSRRADPAADRPRRPRRRGWRRQGHEGVRFVGGGSRRSRGDPAARSQDVPVGGPGHGLAAARSCSAGFCTFGSRGRAVCFR